VRKRTRIRISSSPYVSGVGTLINESGFVSSRIRKTWKKCPILRDRRHCYKCVVLLIDIIKPVNKRFMVKYKQVVLGDCSADIEICISSVAFHRIDIW